MEPSAKHAFKSTVEFELWFTGRVKGEGTEAVKAEDMSGSRATKAGSSSLIIMILCNNLLSRRLKVKGKRCLFVPEGASSRAYVSLALFACVGPFHEQKETSASFD